MFDQMSDHFLAPSSTTNTTFTTTNNLTFSIQNGNFQGFDGSYLFHGNPLLHLQQQQNGGNQAKGSANSVLPVGSLQEGSSGRSPLMSSECVVAPWSDEEVLALLKIISSMDNPWFPPEFTWENVSRKMAEFGFKRSPKKCKDKFEEETRSFTNNSNKSNIISQNYRFFGELEALYNNNNNNNNNTNTNTNTNTNDNGGDYYEERNRHPNQHDHENENDDNGDVVVQEEVEKMGQEENSGNDDGMEEDVDEQQSVDDSEKTDEENTKKIARKRRRQKKFEMFKGFCEKIVNKMIGQQEELHCKILRDMVKREEEKFAREDGWRKHEIDKITQELQVIRAHEQAIVGDRQAKILGFLDKFSSSSSSSSNNVMKSQSIWETFGNNVMIKVPYTDSLSNSSSNLSQDSISPTTHDQDSSNPNLLIQQKCNLSISLSKESNLAPQSPNRLESPKLGLPMSSPSLHQTSNSKSPNLMTSSQSDFFRLASTPTHQSSMSDHTSTEATGKVMDIKSLENHNDTGRRWPRDEVLALINIRCSLFNNNGDLHQDKENLANKGPLWERISQKMIEFGYKRSAKRCKEKWENINKYFRKTKDLNKKRSIDSRTCPYFHQLSHLYNQGPLLVQPDRPANLVIGSPDNQSVPSSDARGGFNTINAATTTTSTVTVLGSQGNEASVVQESTGFGFEF